MFGIRKRFYANPKLLFPFNLKYIAVHKVPFINKRRAKRLKLDVLDTGLNKFNEPYEMGGARNVCGKLCTFDWFLLMFVRGKLDNNKLC